MGLRREYRIPALMSSELARDGAPLRLMLLGEKLIAFRDSAGQFSEESSLPDLSASNRRLLAS